MSIPEWLRPLPFPSLTPSIVIAAGLLSLGSVDAPTAGGGYPFPVGKTRILSADSTLRVPAQGRPRIRVTVASSVCLGPVAGTYTYTYVVSSEASNKIGIETFGLRRVPPPDSIRSPEQWEDFYGHLEEDSAVVWACTDTVTDAPPGWDSVQVFPSPYGIQPGQSKTFEVLSHDPPAPTVECRVQEFQLIPEEGRYSTGDEGPADYPSLWRAGVAGRVWGPAQRGLARAESGHGPETTVEPGAAVSGAAYEAANIAFALALPATVDLSVYDGRGRLVKRLLKGPLPAGYHSSTWAGQTSAGRDAAPGTYFLELRAGGAEVGRKRIILSR